MPRLARFSLIVVGLTLAILAWRVFSAPPPAESDATRDRPPTTTPRPAPPTEEQEKSPGEPLPALVVLGRVLGPDGDPVPDAAVTVWTLGRHGGPDVIGRGVSAADGGFALGSRSVALLRVTASSAGFVTAVGGWFDAEGRSEVDVGTIRLRKGLAIAGRVVDLGGNPVAGDVALECEADPVPEWWEPLRFASDGWFATPIGEKGEFRLDGVPSGRYRIAVEVEIGEDWETFTREHVEAGTEDLLVVVPEGASPDPTGRIRINFRVLDPEGRPVPRGRFFVSATGCHMSGPFGDGALDETMEGTYPAWVLVFATEDGAGRRLPYLPTRVRLTGSSETPVEIRLQPGREVRGHVLVDGVPAAASLEVIVPMPGDDVLEENARSVRFDVRTDADGVFVIPGLPTGTITLAPARGGPFVYQPPEEVTVGAQDVTVRLRRARDLKIVVKVPAGLPAANISAVLFETTPGGRRWRLMSSSVTEPEETWTLDAKRLDPEKRYELVVTATRAGGGYAPSHVRDLIPGGPPVEVTLAEGPTISGTVTRGDGSPVAGASVRAIRPGPTGGRARRFLPDTTYGQPWSPVPDPSTTTDRHGRFRLGGIGEHRVLLVATAAGLCGLAEPIPARAGESGVVLVLEPARTISGRVVDETGQAPGRLRVEAWPESGPPELVVLGGAHRDGFFETGWLAAGRYRLIAWNRWDDDDRIGVLESIPAGARDVRLTIRKGESLTGVVRDADGNAVDGARVDLRGPSAVRHVLTYDDGSFEFRALTRDRHRLRASVTGPPARSVSREVTPGDGPVDLVLGID